MPRRLFVFVRPISRGSADWDALTQRIGAEPGAEGFEFRVWPERPKDAIGLLTRGPLTRYAHALAAQLQQWDEVAARRGDPYEAIVLVGNSIGALVVRWAWLYGAGAFSTVEAKPWAAKVERIVLVAGINRGLDTRRDHRPSTLVTRLLISLTSWLGFTWRDALAGAPFVTNLRLTWMRFLAELATTAPRRIPQVVQLLGTDDPLVTREDSRDIEQFPGAAHVVVAGATHGDVLSLAVPDADDRYLTLKSYLLDGAPETQPSASDDAGATDVVFVLHGIRAGRWGWIRGVQQLLDGEPTWRVVTPTYRYFSAGAFAVPIVRRRKVRWFLDQYSREFAGHRRARFHFVGHSNGTYVLGRALEDVPAVRFDRVYLAGSVLPAEYAWRRRHDDGQVRAVRSDRGRRDLPVALLSRGLRGLRMRDIGGGGFEGFTDLGAAFGTQWGYFPGGHSAPLADDDRRASAVAYVRGEPADPPNYLIDDGGGWLAPVSRAAPVLVPAAVVGLIVLMFVQPEVGVPLAILVAIFLAVM